MAYRIKLLKARHIVIVTSLVVVSGLLCIVALRHQSTAPDTGPSTVTAQIQPLELAITLVGTIGTSQKVEVAAPFDSVVRLMPVHLGQEVVVGQPLISFDTTELEQHVREAESAALKAAQTYQALIGWNKGLNAARVKRSQVAALATINYNKERLRETEKLYGQGIVARSELDSLKQQIRSDQATWISANDEWRALEQQASPENRRVAEIDYKNAVEQLNAARQLLAQAVLLAPSGGTLVRPQVKNDAYGEVAVGATIRRGQPLFAIANRQHLNVLAKIDESDANRIKEGQRIQVSSAAFPMPITGKISSIAGEAMPDSQPGSASFMIIGELDPLPAALRQLVKLGMTANVRIIVDSRRAALVVPLPAIRGAAPYAEVMAQNQSGEWVPRPVKIGLITETGAEILSGLKVNEPVRIVSP